MEQLRNRLRHIIKLISLPGLILSGPVVLAGILVGVIHHFAPGSTYVATYVLYLVLINTFFAFIIGPTSPKMRVMALVSTVVLVLLGYGYYGLLYFGLVL